MIMHVLLHGYDSLPTLAFVLMETALPSPGPTPVIFCIRFDLVSHTKRAWCVSNHQISIVAGADLSPP